MPPRGRTATLCTGTSKHVSGSRIPKLFFITKLQRPAGVVLLWGGGESIKQIPFQEKSAN